MSRLVRIDGMKIEEIYTEHAVICEGDDEPIIVADQDDVEDVITFCRLMTGKLPEAKKRIIAIGEWVDI